MSAILESLKTRWAYLFEKNICALFVNKKVLDLGCLDGFASNKFFLNGAKEVVGVDIYDEYLSVARSKYPNILFLKKDVENFNIQNEYYDFDVIACYGLLYLLKDPILFINNLSKSLNKKIIMIETVANYDEKTIIKKTSDKKMSVSNNCQFININEIKEIFLKNSWNLKVEKKFTVKELNKKISENLFFGERVLLVFEK